jgi:hypothetical protein
MSSRAEQLETMARECRALAETVKHDEVRAQLLAVAEQFERLAQHHRGTASSTLPFETPGSRR